MRETSETPHLRRMVFGIAEKLLIVQTLLKKTKPLFLRLHLLGMHERHIKPVAKGDGEFQIKAFGDGAPRLMKRATVRREG